MPPPAQESTHRTGTVIRSTGSWYDVDTGSRVVPSKIRGKFRLEAQTKTNPVVVGDRVTIRLNEDDTGLITDIAPRTNKLSRRAAGRRVGIEHIIAANIDAAWVVQAVRLPVVNPGFIDRFLVMAEVYGIAAGVVLNKLDLLRPKDEEAVAEIVELYEALGYPVLLVSAETKEGVDAFRAALLGQTSVVSGPSGVGKSTLLNAVQPDLDLRTGEVSRKTRKGKHTTTYAALYPLSDASGQTTGYVVDTPGIREFGIVDLEPSELDGYFVEFRPYLNDCRFPNCTHDHEPDCAVKDAVDRYEIAGSRYGSYLGIYDSLVLGDADVGR
ncbi:MAG: ribosome small subunit-dependent GTPase A [Bacteroidota bacterium]